MTTGAPAALRCSGVAAGLWALLLAWVLLSGTAAAQEIERDSILWGFDNRCVVGRFNLLTLRVSNPTDTPVDKHLHLQRYINGLPRGAVLVQRCYLSPGARKTLQFHPFVVLAGESWYLSWAEGGAAPHTVIAQRDGPPALVFLERIGEANRRLRLPCFDPDLLPTSATAMDALRAVVIDRIPKLNGPRAKALIEWVRGGGTVHQLLDDGRFRDFPPELAVLQPAEDVLHFGAGRVVRHAFERGHLRRNFPKELAGGFPETGAEGYSATSWLRGALRSRIASDHSWGVIFLLAVGYLLLVGPLFYRLSVRVLTWPVALLVLSVVVGLATWVFTIIGARGYGEGDSVHAVCCAHGIGDDQYDVIRYANVFTTRGVTRTIRGGDAFSLFSSAQVQEQVNGQIRNGAGGSYAIDMPRFSSRLVIQQNRVQGPKHGFAVTGGTAVLALPATSMIEIHDGIVDSWVPRGAGKWVRDRGKPVRSWLQGSNLDQFEEDTLRVVVRSRLLRKEQQLLAEPGRRVFFAVLQDSPKEFQLPLEGVAQRALTILRFDPPHD